MSEAILLELSDQELARFNAHIWRLEGSCWPWIDATTWGYGAVKIRGLPFRANRVAWILGHGELIPDDLDIAHTCDYRRCCNPAHLVAKPRVENVADMMKRGRHWRQGFVYVEPPLPEVPLEVRLAGLREFRVANFWANTQKASPNECWLWTGSKNEKGYGLIELKCRKLGVRKNYLAHRLSLQIATGKPTTAPAVRHTCDVRACVNPAHLVPGTQTENIKDMWAKGRAASFVGEGNGRAKIDAGQVVYVRAQVAAGRPRRELAVELDVHVQTIHDIVSRKSWNHIA